MTASIKEEDGEYYLVFDDECPFNVGDTIEWVLEKDRVILRVVQQLDLFES